MTKYTLEFKEEAARLVVEKGYKQKEAAQIVGVSPKNLTRWVQDFNLKYGKRERQYSEQDEVKRLREENEQLRMECEILKKAAAFCANKKRL
jgi:transposase